MAMTESKSSVSEKSGHENGVRFYGPYDRSQHARLQLRNTTATTVVYRLKCNQPLFFNIQPNSIGMLDQQESHLLTLNTLADVDPKTSCTLVLEIGMLSAADVGRTTNAAEAWNLIAVENHTKIAIPVFFESKRMSDEKKEVVVICIGAGPLEYPTSHIAQLLGKMRIQYPNAWFVLKLSLLLAAILSFLAGFLTGTRFSGQQAEPEPLPPPLPLPPPPQTYFW